MTEAERAKEFLMLYWPMDVDGHLLSDPARLSKFIRGIVKRYSYVYIETGDRFIVVDELLDLANELEKLEDD